VLQAIAEGKTTLANRQGELGAWAFGREGLMPEGTGKVDVLTVDAWAKGMARPITFVQRFRPYSSGAFGITGDAMVVVDGKVLEGPEAARLVKRLYDGVRQHPKAGVPSDASPHMGADRRIAGSPARVAAVSHALFPS
jgi:hypothetical protein